MEEFSQEDLDSLINEALSGENSKLVPKNGLKLGLYETNMLSHMHETFSKHIPNERLVSLFQDVRNDILTSKNSLSLKDLHTVTKNCKKCPNVMDSSELPRWNSQNPDVLFIVDNPRIEKESAESMVDLDEIATVMMMSSDELFVELLARVEYDESLRKDVSMTTLIQELTNRALHMELLCEVATQMNQ